MSLKSKGLYKESSPAPQLESINSSVLSLPYGPTFTFVHYFWKKHVQSRSHVQLFAIPWTAAHQASLSFTISQSLLKFMSTELVMLPNHIILCCPLLLLLHFFPSSKSFLVSRLLVSGGQKIGVSDLAAVLQ